MEYFYLHSDIIFEILLRTSTDTLGRCRLASKEWNQTTYDSKFKKVRSQKTNIVDGFFVQELIRRQYVSSFASFSDETHQISLDFVPGFNVRVIAVSANRGIIFCTSDNPKQYWVPRFFVCKPQVQLSQQIPNPRTRFFALGVAMSVLCSNPFRCKILRISSPKAFVKNCQQLILEVFDSEAWQWERLKDILLPYGVWFFSETTVVEACGAFHWLLSTGLIFSFDIEKEEWKIIRLPVVEDDYRCINMAKYEWKLGLMCMDMEGYMHTWVLESYINMVWKKRFVINMKEPGSTYVTYRPLAFYGSDIIVVRGSSSSLKYYDFKNEKLLKESKLEIHYFPRDIFPFWSDSEPCCLRQGREHDIQCWSETGKPKGYGFCEYKDEETALSARRNLQGYEINGRQIRVDFCRK